MSTVYYAPGRYLSTYAQSLANKSVAQSIMTSCINLHIVNLNGLAIFQGKEVSVFGDSSLDDSLENVGLLKGAEDCLFV